MASANATTDHDQIRKWVESRGGHPAHVKRTGGKSDPGMLRIDYPGYSGAKTLERISWDKWFRAFDKNNLAFLYQGGRSRFSKLVDRAAVKKASTTSRTRKASSAKSSTTTRKRTASTRKKSTTSPSASKRTTNHNVIRRWVEARGGWPATVKGTKRRGEEAGLLRIDYPGYSGKGKLQRITWDEFFEKFDEENLAFVYQNKANSRFSKLVRR